MDNLNDVYHAYESWSKTYDQQTNPTRDLNSQVLKKLLSSVEGLSVVEAGCGTGLNSAWIAPHCKTFVGLDLSDSMLKLAQQKIQVPHSHFVQHDLQKKWPVASQTADLVLINLVLEHIEVIDPILQHATEVMKQGAQLIITEYHPNRVLSGSGAQIKNDTQKSVTIINFWHPVEVYMDLIPKLGLQIKSIDEWTAADFNDVETATTAADSSPLLLSLQLEKL